MSAEIADQLRGIDRAAKYRRRVQSFGPEWIEIDEASRILCCSRKSFGTLRWDGTFIGIDSRPASEIAGSARGCGLLLKKSDIERISVIRRRCRLSLSSASRVWAAIKSGGPL